MDARAGLQIWPPGGFSRERGGQCGRRCAGIARLPRLEPARRGETFGMAGFAPAAVRGAGILASQAGIARYCLPPARRAAPARPSGILASALAYA